MPVNHLLTNDLEGLIQQIAAETLKGIRHGHFEFTIIGDGNTNGNRSVTFKAGLSHRYMFDLFQIPKTITTQVTFEPKAQSTNTQALETSLQDAQADRDVNSEHRGRRKRVE